MANNDFSKGWFGLFQGSSTPANGDFGKGWFDLYIPSATASSYSDGTASDGLVFSGDSVLEEITITHNDGTSSDGLVIGGLSGAEVYPNFYNDLSSIGGIVLNGSETVVIPVDQIEAISSGGMIIGGDVYEEFASAINNLVAIKGGTYRISGIIYILENTITHSDLGPLAAIKDCGNAPATVGYWRYDLLSVDIYGVITITRGDSGLTPEMPAVPTGSLKLNHVLRYYGQINIYQSDIGKIYVAPILARIEAAVSDQDLAWAELTSTITITGYDQYNQVYLGGGVSVLASFLRGNGTISPASRYLGGSGMAIFTYTRGQADPGDISPNIKFSTIYGHSCSTYILLQDSAGDYMI